MAVFGAKRLRVPGMHKRITYRMLFLGRLLGSWLLLGECQPVAAAKHLEARISLRNEVRLKASFGVPDRSTPAEMWRRLEAQTFEAIGPIAADPASKEISMGGEVRIEIIWVKTTEAA